MTIVEAIPHRPEADSFQIQGAIDNIKQAVVGHKWVVLTCMLLTVVFVAVFVTVWPPTFEAEVMVAADSEKDVQRQAFYQGWNIFRRDGLTDEATLMTGPPVLKEVIKRLDLKYDDIYHPFASHAVHLWMNSTVGRNYRAFKDWLFGKKKGPYVLSEQDLERAKLLADFQSGVAVRQVGEASIGLLIVKGSSPRVAEIANKIVEVYLEQRRDRFVAEATQAHASLLLEAEKTQKEIDELDKEVKQFRADSGAVLLFEKDRVQIGQWFVLRSAVTDLEAQIAENQSSLAMINKQLEGEGSKLSSDRLFREEAAKDRLTKLEMQLAAMKQTFKPEAPEVKDIEEQIRVSMAALGDAKQASVVRNSQRISDSYEVLRAKKLSLESQLAGAQSSLKVKKTELENMRSMLDTIPSKMQTNHELERRQLFLESKYAGLNEKLTVAAVSMATARSAPAAMRVVEPAALPEQPVWPKTKLMIIVALVAGLGVGVLAALVLELVFVRVNRHRLAQRGDEAGLFAVVEQDEKFVASLYRMRGAA
ncbi:GumC family protein [Piscinibacter terrae]|nr:GNVR domain-containing protein [Albitalea terrae]